MGLGNNYFTITPMSQRLSLEPGKSETGSIKIVNPVNAEEDLNYRVYVAPYSVVGEEYKADLATTSNRTMMTDWIKIKEPTGTLKPNEVREIEFTVKVPETAPAGGQYAAIVFSRDPKSTESNNSVTVQDVFEIASIVYADVSGELIRKGEIIDNNIPGFVTGAPITLSATIKNEGNVHENATVTIVAKDLISGQEIPTTDGRTSYYSELVMPETTRFIQRDINEGLPLVGIVHVEQTISYNGHQSKAEQNVIICPIWFMVVIVAAVCIIAGIIVAAISKHKKKKRKHSSIEMED